MSPESKSLVDFQQSMREAESQWLDSNREVLGEISQNEYDEYGRGVLLVNTQFSNRETGHPYWYLQQSIVEEAFADELIAAVRTYDPSKEFVLSIILVGDRPRMYTLGLPKNEYETDIDGDAE